MLKGEATVMHPSAAGPLLSLTVLDPSLVVLSSITGATGLQSVCYFVVELLQVYLLATYNKVLINRN